MQEVPLKLAGYCPSCGAAATFTPIGDQEDATGGTFALGNCSACGSTVALSSVEMALRPRGYALTIRLEAARLEDLAAGVQAAAKLLEEVGPCRCMLDGEGRV